MTLKLVVFWVFLVEFVCSQNVKVIEVEPIREEETIILDTSSNSTYPTGKVDIAWKFSQDIEIEIKKFGILGQNGDFVMISKQSLPPLPLLPGDLVPIEDFLKNLPIAKTMLLSWNTEAGDIIRLVNPKGVFIYFHGEETDLAVEGFQLHIRAFVTNMDEVQPTTSPPPTRPPGQTLFDYVSKFVTGKPPIKFRHELDKFKAVLAQMTNKYIDNEGILRPNLTEPSDIMISPDGLRFCDRAWDNYWRCVEVTFAIVSYDFNEEYIMKRDRIIEMWDKYYPDLEDEGFYKYDPPKPVRTVGLLWVYVSLGSVVLIAIILCLAWLKKASDEFSKDAEVSKAMDSVTDDEAKFYDRQNPVHQIRKTMVNGKMTKEKGYGDQILIDEYGRRNKTQPFIEHEPIMPETYHVNQFYVPDDDDDEVYFTRPNNSNPNGTYEPHSRSPLKTYPNFDYEDDED